jgi:hypothetical protein
MYRLPPVLTLRGLCPDSALNPMDIVDYIPKQLPGSPNNLFLLGKVSTQIRYNDTTEQWILTDAFSSVTAVSRASKMSYALGKHTWTVTNDVFGCHEGRPYTTQLKLTGCREGQFTCDDGQCINITKRCDQTPNCRDKSDEEGCKLLVLQRSYKKLIPPISTVSPVNDTIVPAHVNVSIVLLKIVKMEETDHKIDMQFEINLEWKETSRLIYHNLQKRTSLNVINDEDVGKLWLPKVIYVNTDQKETTRLGEGGEWSTTLTVTREQDTPERSSTAKVDEIEIYHGDNNTLAMNQTYTHTFQCKYLLHRYPFDTQVIQGRSFQMYISPRLAQ